MDVIIPYYNHILHVYIHLILYDHHIIIWVFSYETSFRVPFFGEMFFFFEATVVSAAPWTFTHMDSTWTVEVEGSKLHVTADCPEPRFFLVEMDTDRTWEGGSVAVYMAAWFLLFFFYRKMTRDDDV